MGLQDFKPQFIVGKGGMGSVWQAVHKDSQQDVAVKILETRSGDHTQFGDELRTLARLDHPNIVRVYDWGYAPESHSGAWNAEPNQPFLVLELVDGATLSQVHMSYWQLVRLTLLGILDALAHAHGRGVVHRDLKPSNVVVRVQGPHLDLRLLDFGIAQLHNASPNETGEMDRLTGTPKYMAPEQIQHHRRMGPWSDLYSLGCIAYKLTTGRAPFEFDDRWDVLRAHIANSPPPLEPHVPVPDGFQAWCMKLLEKHPMDRFAFAADAAYHLLQLGDPPQDSFATGPEATPDDAPTEIFGNAVFDETTWDLEPPEGFLNAAPTVSAPPLALSWRKPNTVDLRTARWTGSALRLFHLRRLPLIGRELEQDLLWTQLHTVARGKPSLVVISGPSGMGKTRLTDWMGERASELGAAYHLVLHAGEGASSLGLMLRRFFGVNSRSKTVTDDVRNWFARDAELTPDALGDCITLVDMMFPDRAPASRAPSAASQYQAFVRFLTLFERPVVFTIDEAESDHFAIELAMAVSRSKAKVLVLVTLTLDAESPPPARFGDLKADANIDLLLEPLTPKAHDAFVAHAAKLTPTTSKKLHQRTGGNPLYTLKTLGDWVDQGYLVPAENHLELAVAAPPLPKDLFAVLDRQIQRVLVDEPTQFSAELAAVLGSNFEVEIFAKCLQEAGIPGNQALDLMSESGLIDPSFGAVRFANGMTREVLLARAGAGGRLHAYHAKCARVLAGESPRRSAEQARVGFHYEAAGQYLQAAEAYLLAAATDDYFMNPGSQARHLQAYDRAIGLWGGEASLVHRATRLRLEARQVACNGNVEQARELTRECMTVALKSGDTDTIAHAYYMASQVVTGDDVADGAKAVALFQEAGNRMYATASMMFHSRDLAGAGRTQEAFATLKEAHDRAMADNDTPLVVSSLVHLSGICFDLGRLAECEAHLDRADKELELSPDRINRAGLALIRAQLLFVRGAFDQALETLAIADQLADELENGHLKLMTHIRIASVAITQGKVEECKATLDQCHMWRGSPMEGLLWPIDAALAATEGDTNGLRSALTKLQKKLGDKPQIRGMGPWLLETAGHKSTGALRLHAYSLAGQWWTQLGRQDDAARVAELVRQG